MAKIRNTIIVVFGILIGLYCLKSLASKAFDNWDHSSSYGQETVKLANGTKIHIIRESWGLHFNQIHLSQRRNCECEPANPGTDYVLDFNSGELIYKVTSQGLNIYVPEPSDIHKPLKEWANVVSTGEYNEMAMHPSRYGAIKTRVPHDQWCLINWFRKSSSARSND